MRLTRSSVLRYFLPILIILALIILLTIALSRLANVQRAMRSTASANMIWVIHQANVETLMLKNAAQHQLLAPESKNELPHRYKMLLSRINVLNDGPQKRALQTINMAELFANQAAEVARLGNFLEADNLERTDYERLKDALNTLSTLLHQAASKAMVAQWETEGARIDSYRNAVLTIIFLMMAVWICSIAISVQLLLTLKRVKDNERAKQRGIELQKQLENERRINDLYRSFGSMVSHQFRTPLAIIDATMQRLIRAGDRIHFSEIRHRANKARQATQRLNDLIETILQADRFMEQLEVNMQAVCLDDLARQAIAEHKTLAPHREIQFQNDAESESLIRCDPILTNQILSNMLSNALKYSCDNTPVLVYIYCDADKMCCAIRDWGRGISLEDLQHVFKRYFRARTATDTVGTGIGLHIATELASLQNGDMQVYSEIEKGTTFVLRLPSLHRHELPIAKAMGKPALQAGEAA